MEEIISYDVIDEPISLSKSVIDLLLKTAEPSDSIALYTFLYYTAKWQKSNTAKATVGYIMKGLKWSERRVSKVKKILIKVNLIENIKRNTEKDKGWYVKINFIWCQETITKLNQIKQNKSEDLLKRRSYKNPKICDKEDLLKRSTNALSAVNINALSVVIDTKKDKWTIQNQLNDLRTVIPPLLQNVKTFFKINEFNSDPEKYFFHYDAIGWKKGNTKITDWISNASLWEKYEIPKTERHSSVIDSSYTKLKKTAI